MIVRGIWILLFLLIIAAFVFLGGTGISVRPILVEKEIQDRFSISPPPRL